MEFNLDRAKKQNKSKIVSNFTIKLKYRNFRYIFQPWKNF